MIQLDLRKDGVALSHWARFPLTPTLSLGEREILYRTAGSFTVR